MAKQRFGVNDAYRGTVGTVIGYEWRGSWCLRARPLHVRNPRTAKQQSNRQLFKQMVDLASHMKFVLRKGLRGVSLGMHVTECNLFVKRNKGSGDDEVYVYAYCPEMEEGVLSASAWRQSGSVQLTLPERWQGKTVHLYGFAVDEKGAASDTVYIGAMEMAKYPIRAATKDISPKSTVGSQ